MEGFQREKFFKMSSHLLNAALEKTLENPLDCKEIKPVNPKGNQPWIFIGRTDAEAETPILWPPDSKSQLIRKDPDAGKDWGRRRRDGRGWHGRMASSTRWTWVWARSRRWLRTEKPGVLQSTVLQRVGLDWATEQEQRIPTLKLTLNFSNGSKIFHFTIGNSVLKGSTLRKGNRFAVIPMGVQMTLSSVVCGQHSWRRKKGTT